MSAPGVPHVSLPHDRVPGCSAGSVPINFAPTVGLFSIVFVGLLIATIPKVPVVPLLAVLVPIAVLGPIIYYPFSKTVWVATDRALLQRLDPNERLD